MTSATSIARTLRLEADRAPREGALYRLLENRKRLNLSLLGQILIALPCIKTSLITARPGRVPHDRKPDRAIFRHPFWLVASFRRFTCLDAGNQCGRCVGWNS